MSASAAAAAFGVLALCALCNACASSGLARVHVRPVGEVLLKDVVQGVRDRDRLANEHGPGSESMTQELTNRIPPGLRREFRSYLHTAGLDGWLWNGYRVAGLVQAAE
jgi:hypothetical protein